MPENHTPTPWVPDMSPNRASSKEQIIAYDKTRTYCRVLALDDGTWGRAVAKANAALIVRAVNHHEELVEALREYRVVLESLQGVADRKSATIITQSLKDATAILAKVKEARHA